MKHNRKLAPSLELWLQDYNTLLQTLEKNGFKQTPTNAREGLATLTRKMVTERPEIAWVQDDLVEGELFNVPIRIYHPSPKTDLPILVYFHGGGGMAGSITVYDPICRKLSLATDHIVISVDYRLAPECPYPCGLTDALAVVKNLWTTLNRRGLNYVKRLSIGGDSGGGALCASVAHTTQHDNNITIDKQILIYPSLDYTMATASIDENKTGFLLHKEKIQWFFDNYFQNNEDRKTVSPLFMEFTANLPESLVMTAEFCPLRDEGLAYVKKLQQAQVPTQHHHYENMVHAFLNLENLVKEQCDTFYRKAGAFLNDSSPPHSP